MAHLTQLAREAPGAARGARPTTTVREDLITMLMGAAPIVALHFDGYNHNNKVGQDSFFSLAHIALYATMTAVALWVALLVLKYQKAAGVDVKKLVPDLKAIPVGYGVTIIGFFLLGAAGPADFIWHELYGFETNIDAVYSPPHLVLFFSGMLVATTGIRSMWAKDDVAPDLMRFAPVVFSTALFVAMAGFFTMYQSAFMTNVSMHADFDADLARFQDVRGDETIGLNPGLTGYGDALWPYSYYSVGHGVAAMVITTIVVLGPILMIMRRWRVPYGSMTIALLLYGLVSNIMTGYSDAELLIPLVLTGLTVDVLQQRLGWKRGDGRVTLGGIRVVGTAAAAVLWCSYYLVVAVTQGIGWDTSVWTGTLLVLIGAGFGLAFLIAPPSYGPRLVEGEPE